MGTYSQLLQLNQPSQSPPAPDEKARPEIVTSPSVTQATTPTPTEIPTLVETTERIPERTEIRTHFRSEKRTVTLPYKRRTKRYSFEFYEDQLIVLKRLKYEAEMNGERVNLSDFAREALDQYLKAKGLL